MDGRACRPAVGVRFETMSRAVQRLLTGGGLILAATALPAGAETGGSSARTAGCPLIWLEADDAAGSAERWPLTDLDLVRDDLLLAASRPLWRPDDSFRVGPRLGFGDDMLAPVDRAKASPSPGVGTSWPRPSEVVTLLLLLAGVVILRLR